MGSLFESLTQAVLGSERYTTNSNMDVNPDAVNEEKFFIVESKATAHHCFRVPVYQLINYRTVLDDWMAEGDEYKCLYALWKYSAKKLSTKQNGKAPTVGEIVKRVVESVERVCILDITIILRLHQLAESWACPETVSVRDYNSWRGYGVDQPYYCLNVGHRWLNKLVDQTERMLNAMRLTGSWLFQEHSRAGDLISLDGKIFETPPVHVFECLNTQPWGYRDRWTQDCFDAPF